MRMLSMASAVSIGVLGTARAEDDPKPGQGGALHTVQVALRQDGATCRVTAPKDKLRVTRADVVRWTFANGCRADMDLGVGKFRWNQEYGPADQERDKDPLHPDDRRSVKVRKGASGAFQSRIKPQALVPRSYKYDILDGTATLLDPEIEISR
jgi:hypothetical protein